MHTARSTTARVAIGLGVVLAMAGGAGPGNGKGGGGGGGGGGSAGSPAIVYNTGSAIATMNADGSGTRVVVDAVSGLSEPVFSPDGTAIAFIGSPGAGWGLGLYTVNTDGTGLTMLIPTTVGSGMCAWSPVPAPDGSPKIAYTDRPDPDPLTELFLINTDGTGLTRITYTPSAGERYVSWSPDAQHIVVTHQFGTEGACLIYTLGLDAYGQIGPAMVTDISNVPGGPLAGRLSGDIRSADWSRAGDRIAVSAGGSGSLDIWIIDLANPAAAVNITGGLDRNNDDYPTWSPDDSKLMVYRVGSRTGLSTINADGTGLKLVTRSGRAPDWKRVP